MAKATTKTAAKTAPPKTAAKPAAAQTPQASAEPEAVAVAVPPEFTVGVVTTFSGYAEPLPPGQEPILQPGEEITITEINEETGAMVVACSDGRTDTCFSDELSLPEAASDEVVEPSKGAVATKKAAGAAQPKAPAKVKAPAKAPAKAATKAATKGTAKKAPVVAQPKAQEPQVPALRSTPAVEEMMAAGDPLTAATALMATYEETYFTLGGVIAYIYHNESYKSLGERYAGKMGWQLYLEEQLGLGYRKAMTLIEMYKTFSEMEVDEKRLTAIGWTKVRGITKHMTPDNAEELLTYAEEHSREEVDEYVKTTFSTDSAGRGAAQPAGERVKRVSYKMAVLDTEVDTVNEALAAAKQMHETGDDNGPAFAAICADWLQLIGGNDVTLEEVIERVQTQFDVVLKVDGGEETSEAAA